MTTLRATVTTPWARAGQTFEVERISELHRHHLASGALVEVPDAAEVASDDVMLSALVDTEDPVDVVELPTRKARKAAKGDGSG